MKNGFLTAAETLNGVYTIGSVTLVAFAAAGAVAAPWTMAGVMVLGSLSYVADEYID